MAERQLRSRVECVCASLFTPLVGQDEAESVLKSKLICLVLLATGYSCATCGQIASPNDWPSQTPVQGMHGRTVQAKLVRSYPPDAKNQDSSVVRIRIGVNAYGDVRTMKVLSGDKALVKNAKTFLVKTKFPEAPKPDAVAAHDEPPDFLETLRFRVYDVTFSTSAAKTKP